MNNHVTCKLWILFVLDEKTLSKLNLTSVKVLQLRVLRLHAILRPALVSRRALRTASVPVKPWSVLIHNVTSLCICISYRYFNTSLSTCCSRSFRSRRLQVLLNQLPLLQSLLVTCSMRRLPELCLNCLNYEENTVDFTHSKDVLLQSICCKRNKLIYDSCILHTVLILLLRLYVLL